MKIYNEVKDAARTTTSPALSNRNRDRSMGRDNSECGTSSRVGGMGMPEGHSGADETEGPDTAIKEGVEGPSSVSKNQRWVPAYCTSGALDQKALSPPEIIIYFLQTITWRNDHAIDDAFPPVNQSATCDIHTN